MSGWPHGQNPWSGSWWLQCKPPACFGRVHRLLCGNSSQVQDFHKGETSTRLLPASQVVVILALESVVIVITARLVGATGLLEGRRPVTWLAIRAEALIEHATVCQIRGGDARLVGMFPGVTGMLWWKVG